MAGGKGSRLLPYTEKIPKPLVKIDKYPILEIIIKQLNNYKMQNIALTLGHLSHKIKSFLEENYSKLNFDCVYEKEPLGTAGSIKLFENLNDTFLVMNGDVLSNIDYDKLINYHLDSKSDLTIAGFKKEVKIELGVLESNSDQDLINYIEKPKYYKNVSMGIYIMEPVILNFIENNKYIDIPELIQKLLKSNKKVKIYDHNGKWMDIGNPDDYINAQKEFIKNKDIYFGN